MLNSITHFSHAQSICPQGTATEDHPRDGKDDDEVMIQCGGVVDYEDDARRVFTPLLIILVLN